jgi:superfamily II DNA or RNA helicase
MTTTRHTPAKISAPATDNAHGKRARRGAMQAPTGAPAWESDLRLKLRDAPPPLKPRDHQIAAWDRMTAYYVNERRQSGIVVLPTGGGKTVLAAHWLLENHIRSGGRVLWLAHRRGLLRQAMNTFRALGNVAFPKTALHLATVSSIDSKWAEVSPEHDAVFSSMQTAVLEGNAGFVQQYVNEAKGGVFVVVDEAHHAPAPSYARLLRTMKGWGCKLLGLTATPVRANDEDERRLAALFDERVIYQVTRRELTEKGILAAPAFETVKTEVNFEKDFTPEDYKYLARYGEIGPRVLDRLAKNAHRNALIVAHYLQKKETYGPTIVFAADTLHAHTLSEEFKKSGVDADHVDYSRKNAQEIIERYREKRKPDVLVNVEMLTEGFDAPHTRTVFIARPTRSEGLLSQMVGRALRGRLSGGNDVAHLVTFLDTWEQFNVLDAEYVLQEGEDIEKEPLVGSDSQVIVIPVDLVREAYRLLQSNVRGQFAGVFQCLPHSWYAWNETFEDDQQRRSVMVFDNQVAGLKALLAAYAEVESSPAEITEDGARAIVQKYFADVPDPLPRWVDVKALLDAKQKGCEIEHYTFAEKNEFDPRTLAEKIVAQKMMPQEEQALLDEIWNAKSACRSVYRDDFHAFFEDVTRERTNLLAPAKAVLAPEVERIVPKAAPRAWPERVAGYSLVRLRDSVLSVKKHFPNGGPLVGDLRWSSRPSPRLWGFCRYSDKTITINSVLNSPDIPYFVLEYLVFHEMLHADMPSAGHNRDFRARERSYAPSADAVEDAERRGIGPGPKAGVQFWYASADRFLCTFDRYYLHKKPGTTMEVG